MPFFKVLVLHRQYGHVIVQAESREELEESMALDVADMPFRFVADSEAPDMGGESSAFVAEAEEVVARSWQEAHRTLLCPDKRVETDAEYIVRRATELALRVSVLSEGELMVRKSAVYGEILDAMLAVDTCNLMFFSEEGMVGGAVVMWDLFPDVVVSHNEASIVGQMMEEYSKKREEGV